MPYNVASVTERDAANDIAYNEARLAVSDQSVALDALQARAAFIGSAAAVVVTLVGQRAAAGDGLTPALKLALAAYLAIGVPIGYVLWPRPKWRFHFQAGAIHWHYIEGPNVLSTPLIRRDLALHLDAYFEKNARQLDRMAWALAASIVFLLAASGAFVYDLFGG